MVGGSTHGVFERDGIGVFTEICALQESTAKIVSVPNHIENMICRIDSHFVSAATAMTGMTVADDKRAGRFERNHLETHRNAERKSQAFQKKWIYDLVRQSLARRSDYHLREWRGEHREDWDFLDHRAAVKQWNQWLYKRWQGCQIFDLPKL
jgi:hypothetical protein